MNGSHSIDGLANAESVTPANVADLCGIVRDAAADGSALYPVGGGTMLHRGRPATTNGRVVDLTALNQVIDYPHADMTITVRAGIRIAELRRILAEKNQHLPIDIPLATQATLGGSIAANVAGSRRVFGLGTFRDYLIGISAVNDRGEEVKGGGRVVKNVAGYDLMKLLAGSYGTLGIITQATLKVKPVPERRAILAFAVEDPAAISGLVELLKATRPVMVDWVNGAFLAESGARLLVGYEDNAQSVEWQVAQARSILKMGDGTLVEQGEAEAFLGRYTDAQLEPRPAFSLQLNRLSSRLLPRLREWGEVAGIRLHAHLMSGIARLDFDTPPASVEPAQALLTRFGADDVGARTFAIHHAPAEWKSQLPIWGHPRGDWAMMRLLKERLDPKKCFNPGRFIDGI